MTHPLDIPAFLRREPGAPRTKPMPEKVWLKGAPPKPVFKHQIRSLEQLGWSKSQAQVMSRADAAEAIRLRSPATARFMTDLWRDGGDGKPG